MPEPTNAKTEAPAETLQRHLDRQGRLSQWISLEAFGWLQDSQSRQAANEEAENRWWRKKWTGDAMSIGETGESDEMRQTILGDITHPAPIIMPQPPASQSPIPAILLATAAGVGGYFLATQNKPDAGEVQKPIPVVQFDDETISVGLGRIGDYITDESK